MALTGTEADIINCVARLRMAKKDQIRRQVGFSLEYIGYLCRDLFRKGYLGFSAGHYSLAKERIKTLLAEETPKIDRKLLKEVAEEVAREISGELKRTVKGIKIPVSIREIRKETELETPEKRIKINTDFDFPIEDESLALESNINKIGIKMEKEKSDIDKTVKLLNEIYKKGRKND
ncbi:MAG: hypothetical protein L6420_02465 [Elusimicrobia bacterium]|nr:hypothetical protein [Elusimicrobiota bacterium]